MLFTRVSSDICRSLIKWRSQNYKVSVSQIKELRELTGCGISDCKKALELYSGDNQQSIEYLKEKGLASAKQRQSKQTLEGMIGLRRNKNGCILIEMNCETDFVARCDLFIELMKVVMTGLDDNRHLITQSQLNGSLLQEVLSQIETEHSQYGRQSLLETQQLLISKIQENIQIRRVEIIQKEDQQSVGVYIHNSVDRDGEVGQQGCMTRLERQNTETETHLEIADNMALMYLGNQPQCIYREQMGKVEVDRQEEVIREEMKVVMKGKSEEVIRRMLEGKMTKYYQEMVMMDMHYFMEVEETITIEQYMERQQKQIQDQLYLKQCKIWRVGQDII